MSTIVIMPGGFHPFHAGHAALYNSARKAFPNAEVFVAATNDTSNRPFPFAIKEKLAKLAGVESGHFVQVKSPFRAEEITSQFNPEKDRLIFVRSEKDADKPPQAGGVKKDGSPAYLQPLAGQTNIRPFGEHAYMAYLPTVEFGPGMTSATEIRSAWPTLNEKRKTALVMSLYPTTQKNPALAATVVKMLDAAIGSDLTESGMLGHVMFRSKPPKLKKIQPAVSRTKDFMKKDFSLSEDELDEGLDDKPEAGDKITWYYSNQYPELEGEVVGWKDGHLVVKSIDPSPRNTEKTVATYRVPKNNIISVEKQGMAEELSPMENQGWAATFTNENNGQTAGTPASTGMTAGYQQRENQPIDEKKKKTFRDTELIKTQQFAQSHYPTYDAETAFDKWIQRSLKHSEKEDQQQDATLARLANKVDLLSKKLNSLQKNDYIEESSRKK